MRDLLQDLRECLPVRVRRCPLRDALVNKPSKATISDLRGALEDLEHRLVYEREDGPRRTIQGAGDKIRRALDQLTEDRALRCGGPGCTTTKPTTRALAAHRAHCARYREGGPT